MQVRGPAVAARISYRCDFSLSCPDAQRGYRHAIDEFVDLVLVQSTALARSEWCVSRREVIHVDGELSYAEGVSAAI